MEEKLFDLVSTYTPQGDQPQAIDKLVEGIRSGKKEQVRVGDGAIITLGATTIILRSANGDDEEDF